MRHLESQLQQSCVNFFRYQYPRVGRLLFAVPNGGARNRNEARIMKGEGVTAGVADLILLVPKGKYASLCIELKTENEKQTELQKSWQELTESAGNKYVICRNLHQFMTEIKIYMAAD